MHYYFSLLNSFAEFSGLNVNYDKTEALWIGSMRLSKRMIPFKGELHLDVNEPRTDFMKKLEGVKKTHTNTETVNYNAGARQVESGLFSVRPLIFNL